MRKQTHVHLPFTGYLPITAVLLAALTGLPRSAQADPTRMWGTYWGGTGDDHTHDVAFAGDLSVVAVGKTSSSGIAEPDAHDSTLGGPRDAFVALYESWGDLVWGTYFGGLGEDDFLSVAVDDDDAIHAFGSTTSVGFIATVGAHKTTLSGAQDAMLVKFDVSGDRVWGTYFGGNGVDTGNDVCRGPNGDPYVTRSPSPPPIRRARPHRCGAGAVRAVRPTASRRTSALGPRALFVDRRVVDMRTPAPAPWTRRSLQRRADPRWSRYHAPNPHTTIQGASGHLVRPLPAGNLRRRRADLDWKA